jgi:hypothetical protein
MLATAGSACTQQHWPVQCGSGAVATAAWKFGNIDGVELDTDHYRIFTTTNNRTLQGYLPGFMECAYADYLRLTGLPATPGPAEGMNLYVFADRAQWAAMTQTITGPQADTYLSIQFGGYCFEGTCVLWDLRSDATFSIAAHEGLHQFFHHRLCDPLPAWTEEGLCVLAEAVNVGGETPKFDPQHHALRISTLRQAEANGRMLPLTEMLSTDAGDQVIKAPGQSPEYYAQLWALLMYIRSEPAYRAGLEKIIADAAAGKLRTNMNMPADVVTGRAYSRGAGQPIFEKYITRDLAGFEQGYRVFAKKLAGF